MAYSEIQSVFSVANKIKNSGKSQDTMAQISKNSDVCERLESLKKMKD
jgi:hypothetical protein